MMSSEAAQTIAIKALSWIARDEELLSVLMNSTGIVADEIATRATDADFQIAILDFLTMDDAWVRGFCEESGLQPETPLLARQSLPGGKEVHWT